MLERLQKAIAKAGITSRRQAEEMILEGRVQVNGKVVTELGTKVDLAKDYVKVDQKRISIEPHKVYLLLNKPKEYITSLRDPQGRPTVIDLVRDIKERVYPVGRLDYDSEGLLLLTNDGDLAEALMHPRSGIEKKYWVKVKGHLTQERIEKVARGGISLPGGKSAPCRIRPLRNTSEHDWVEIILHEGKRRQIRLMMEKIHHPVLKLKRVGYAFLRLEEDLPPGHYRRLLPLEVKRLKALVEKKEGAKRHHLIGTEKDGRKQIKKKNEGRGMKRDGIVNINKQ
ncbi:MAG: pseudouridine synthase [Candidatus Manganitrophaceae bacterium]